MSQLSIVIPVFNEADSLAQLHREIDRVATENEYQVEMVFVDDGSNDSSWQKMCEIASVDDRVQCLRFRRNFGKAAAIRAGIDATVAELIVTMDSDLQDDPAEIPKLLAAIKGELGVVSGWKQVRRDPLGKRVASKFFNWIVGWLTGVRLHDHNCGFKIYRREVFDEVKLYGEMHRFIPVLAAARGWPVGEIPVNHRPRKHGRSKYGWTRLPKGFLDLLTVSFLTGFNHRPQHLIGSVGLLSFGAGIVGLVWMAVYWVLRVNFYPQWDPLHQRPLVIYSLAAMLLGAQLLCMGFLAELIIARGQESERTYSIRDRVKCGRRQPPATSVASSNGAESGAASSSQQHKRVDR